MVVVPMDVYEVSCWLMLVHCTQALLEVTVDESLHCWLMLLLSVIPFCSDLRELLPVAIRELLDRGYP